MLTRTVLTQLLRCDIRWHCLSACHLTGVSGDVPLFIPPLFDIMAWRETELNWVLFLGAGLCYNVISFLEFLPLSPRDFRQPVSTDRPLHVTVITSLSYPLKLTIHVFRMFWTRVSSAIFLTPTPSYCSCSKRHVLKFAGLAFLGELAWSRKATTCIVVSAVISVGQQGKTRLSLDAFLWHLVFHCFFENLSWNFKFN
jgi:hypothetical protein